MKTLMKLFCLLPFALRVISVPVVLTPSKDDFYIPPLNFEEEELGTILRYRKSRHKLRSVYLPIEIANSWDILVRSEDSHGNASAVVSTLIEPFNADPNKLVAYNIAQDSSNFDCSATYAIVEGADLFSNLAAQTEFALFAGAVLLSEGYYVMTTAFETTADNKAAFTAGRLAGKNVLNSVKGALNTRNFTGLNDPQVVVWGFSGGGQATAWASALMGDYAPELKSNVIAAAFGGLPSNITETVLSTDKTLFAGLIPNGIYGLIHEYPHLEPIFKSHMNETQWARIKLGAEHCIVPSIFEFAFENFIHPNNSYFTDGLDLLRQEDIAKVLLENTLALNNSTEIPPIPIFMYHGIWDQIVPYVNSERVFKNWCEGGATSIEFATDLTGGHFSDLMFGLPAAAAWIKNQFSGKAPLHGCKEDDYFTLLSYPNVSVQLTDLIDNLQTEFLGKKIGPNVNKRGFYNDEDCFRIFYDK